MCLFSRLSLLLLASLFLLGCQRDTDRDSAPEFLVDLEIVPAPASVGSSLLIIHISPEQATEIGAFPIDIRGDMSHAGMQPVIVSDIQGDLGTYAVPFKWTMAGDWFITISATLPDGRTLERRFPVQVIP